MLIRSTTISVTALAAGLSLFFTSSAGALTVKECSAKYQAAKTAGTLAGQTWNEFRKTQCGATAAPAPAPATPSAAPAPAPNSFRIARPGAYDAAHAHRSARRRQRSFPAGCVAEVLERIRRQSPHAHLS